MRTIQEQLVLKQTHLSRCLLMPDVARDANVHGRGLFSVMKSNSKNVQLSIWRF